jgi:hypothetical protein
LLAALAGESESDPMNAPLLLEQFVGAFHRFFELLVTRDEVLGADKTSRGDVEALLVSPWNEGGWAEWRPRRVDTPVATIEALHRTVGGPLPPLYDELVRNYVWDTVDLGTFRLVENLSPVPASLEREITADPVLFRVLSAGGFAQFGRGPDVDYDPVCFDLRSRDADGDCRIVKIDHEGILIHETLTIVDELAPSFRHLIDDVIQRASRLTRQNAV